MPPISPVSTCGLPQRPSIAQPGSVEATRGPARATATGAVASFAGGQAAHALLQRAGQALVDACDGAAHWLTGGSSAVFKTWRRTKRPSQANRNVGTRTELQRQLAQAGQKAKAAEHTRLAALSDADWRAYQAVLGAVGPLSRGGLALRALLERGGLPGAADRTGGETVLTQLHALSTERLAGGIDRATLLADTLCELENPLRIAQDAKGTCGATTAQILLARRNPAEYVRLVRGLASPGGHVTAVGGTILVRKPDWASNTDGARSISSRLLQPAFMEATEGPWLHYDNTRDATTIGCLVLPGGASASGEAAMVGQVLGQSYRNVTLYAWNRTATWQSLCGKLSAGSGPIPVSMGWHDPEGTEGGHEVQVDRVAFGVVTFTNPWGEQDTMDEGEFLSHLTAVQLPA